MPATGVFSKLLPTVSGNYTFKATYAGTSCQTSFAIVNPSAINDLDNAAVFFLYPNPAANKVSVMADGSLMGSTIMVNDLTGRRVETLGLTGPVTELNADNWPDGIYTVNLTNGKQTSTKKLVIQR
jgi:hypothetical protein